MMNRTAAVFFLFFRRPGEYLPLFWLAGAFVLGFLWSLAYASGLVAEEPLPWPAGRLMFAFYGMLVYGWALPILFSFAAGSRSHSAGFIHRLLLPSPSCFPLRREAGAGG